jgi:hypothetical protein
MCKSYTAAAGSPWPAFSRPGHWFSFLFLRYQLQPPGNVMTAWGTSLYYLSTMSLHRNYAQRAEDHSSIFCTLRCEFIHTLPKDLCLPNFDSNKRPPLYENFVMIWRYKESTSGLVHKFRASLEVQLIILEDSGPTIAPILRRLAVQYIII